MKKAIICITIIAVLIFSGIFAYNYFENVFNKRGETVQLDVRMAALNKDGTKLAFRAESKKVIEKVNFVSETGKIGEAVINSKNIDTVLDVPAETKFLNVSYANEKDNGVLLTLDKEKTYINVDKTETQYFVVVKNYAGIKKIEYYVDAKLHETDLESKQISKKLYIPLDVEDITVENGFGEKVTFNIKSPEDIEKNSSHTTSEEGLVMIKELPSLGIPKGYTVIKNVFAR